MREISPVANLSPEEFLASLPPEVKEIVLEVRRQKQAGLRPRPSAKLMDSSTTMMTASRRAMLLDSVAALVDENLAGRSEMCVQFADLLHRALRHLGFASRPAVGWAMYFSNDGYELFRWKHAWVRAGVEVIDGNVDCLSENPLVPKTVKVSPYWGPVRQIPPDRRLREEQGASFPNDGDVSQIWWPELKSFLDGGF